MTKWNGKRFSIYTSEEETVLGLLAELGPQLDHNTDALENKTDLYGDHKGTWQGLSRPTLSDEGLKSTVEDIVDNKIPSINNSIDNITNNVITEIETVIANIEDVKATKEELEIERNRIDSLTKLGEGSTTGDAELIDGRVGADGVTYTSIGVALRTQLNKTLRTNNIRVTNESHKYYNADNVDNGLIIGYGGAGINIPTTIGTLFCIDSNTTNGMVQLFTSRYNDLYIRTRWNNTWGSWTKINFSLSESDLKGFKTLLPYGRTTSVTDCDTLEVNSVYLVTTDILNLPYKNAIGTLITFSGEKRTNSSGVTQIMYTSIGELYLRINWSNTWGSWKEISTQKHNEQIYGSFSLFETIGVVGDSYASGACGEKPGATTAKDHPSMSWCQQIGRRNGVSVTNYAVGGMSTRSFITNTNFGLPKLKSDTPKGLYILALIRNDYNIENRGESNYIGSIDNIKNGSLGSYPNTFYGNYATIIESIKNHAPGAKIVMMTGDYVKSNTLGTSYNNAMKEIAEHYGLPIMEQLEEDFFNSDYYRKEWANGGHPSAIIYSGMALAIERMFNKCLNEYKSYFTYYNGVSGSTGDTPID